MDVKFQKFLRFFLDAFTSVIPNSIINCFYGFQEYLIEFHKTISFRAPQRVKSSDGKSGERAEQAKGPLRSIGLLENI